MHLVGQAQRLRLVVRDVEDGRVEAAEQRLQLASACSRAAARPGSRAARPSGRGAAGAPARGPARRAAAGPPESWRGPPLQQLRRCRARPRSRARAPRSRPPGRRCTSSASERFRRDAQVRIERVVLEDEADAALSRGGSRRSARRPAAAGPRVARSSPATMRSSVDLPQPEGPSRPSTRPGSATNDTPDSARVPSANTFVSPSARRSPMRQPFTAPRVRPLAIRFSNASTSSTSGSGGQHDRGRELAPGDLVERRAAHAGDPGRHRLAPVARHERQREHELVPAEDEHQDRGGGERGRRQRQADAQRGAAASPARPGAPPPRSRPGSAGSRASRTQTASGRASAA